jgi:hypothetical protein
MEFKDYYKILGLERSATQDEIKKAYRKLEPPTTNSASNGSRVRSSGRHPIGMQVSSSPARRHNVSEASSAISSRPYSAACGEASDNRAAEPSSMCEAKTITQKS